MNSIFLSGYSTLKKLISVNTASTITTHEIPYKRIDSLNQTDSGGGEPSSMLVLLIDSVVSFSKNMGSPIDYYINYYIIWVIIT